MKKITNLVTSTERPKQTAKRKAIHKEAQEQSAT